MADLLESASAWLADVFRQHVSREIVYRRGLAQVTIEATLGQGDLAQVDHSGMQTVYHATDFLFSAADLDFGSGPVEPLRGDTIRLTRGGKTLVYEALDEAGGPHFDYGDPYRTMVRAGRIGLIVRPAGRMQGQSLGTWTSIVGMLRRAAGPYRCVPAYLEFVR